MTLIFDEAMPVLLLVEWICHINYVVSFVRLTNRPLAVPAHSF